MQNLKQIWLASWKQILILAIENLKNVHFSGLILTKMFNVWA